MPDLLTLTFPLEPPGCSMTLHSPADRSFSTGLFCPGSLLVRPETAIEITNSGLWPTHNRWAKKNMIAGAFLTQGTTLRPVSVFRVQAGLHARPAPQPRPRFFAAGKKCGVPLAPPLGQIGLEGRPRPRPCPFG